MPGALVTVATTVTCTHGGVGRPLLPNPRVRAMGQPTVLQAVPYAIAGCPHADPIPRPCVTASFTTGTVRVRSGGVPLLIVTSTAVTTPNGATMTIVPQQLRVSAT
jgi:hypothetical protein